MLWNNNIIVELEGVGDEVDVPQFEVI